jgi:hypothetical protein
MSIDLVNKELNSFSKNSNNNSISNLFDKTYFLNINLIYYIDYLTYKKELIKNISNDIDFILNFFNTEICDILVEIYILNKKKKISDNEFKLFESIYELVYIIEKINFFDQEDFLNIILIFFEIFFFVDKINIFFENFKYNDLINIKILTNRINDLYKEISKNNNLLNIFNIIINSNEDNSIEQLKKLAKYLSFDFFMYYNSSKLYNKIIEYMEKLIKKNDLINNIKINKNLMFEKKQKQFYNFFKNNKNVFINEYNTNFNKHIEIYSNFEFELKIKFKLKNKSSIVNLVESLKYIANIDNK